MSTEATKDVCAESGRAPTSESGGRRAGSVTGAARVAAMAASQSAERLSNARATGRQLTLGRHSVPVSDLGRAHPRDAREVGRIRLSAEGATAAGCARSPPGRLKCPASSGAEDSVTNTLRNRQWLKLQLLRRMFIAKCDHCGIDTG